MTVCGVSINAAAHIHIACDLKQQSCLCVIVGLINLVASFRSPPFFGAGYCVASRALCLQIGWPVSMQMSRMPQSGSSSK